MIEIFGVKNISGNYPAKLNSRSDHRISSELCLCLSYWVGLRLSDYLHHRPSTIIKPPPSPHHHQLSPRLSTLLLDNTNNMTHLLPSLYHAFPLWNLMTLPTINSIISQTISLTCSSPHAIILETDPSKTEVLSFQALVGKFIVDAALDPATMKENIVQSWKLLRWHPDRFHWHKCFLV